MGFEIFVSHSHFDTDFCVRLVDGLYARLDDADIFFDKSDMSPGDRFFDVIQKEVLRRPIFVVILSPHSVIAPWVRTETELALYHAVKNPNTRWIMPVRYKKCTPGDLAAVLELRHFADCTEDETQGFDTLADAIRGTAPGSAQSIHWLPPASQRNQSTKDSEDALRLAADVHDAFNRGIYLYVITVGSQILGKPGNETNAELYAEVGYALLKTASGNANAINESLSHLTRAVDLGPQRADFLSWKAQACAQSGDMEGAFSAWNEALANTSSFPRKVAIFAEMLEAARQVGQSGIQRARDSADMAVQYLAAMDIPDDFSFGWQYWADMCAAIEYYERALEALDHELAQHPQDSVLLRKKAEWSQRVYPNGQQPDHPESDKEDERGSLGESEIARNRAIEELDIARQRALSVLVEVVGALTREKRTVDFPMINTRLQSRGVRYRDLKFARLIEFIHFAEDRQLIRVDWTKTRERVHVATEEWEQTASPGDRSDAMSSSAPLQPDRIAPLTPLQLLDVLDKKLPFMTHSLLAKQFAEAGYSESDLLDVAGVLQQYRTATVHFSDGTAGQVEALRINRGAPEMRDLYLDNPSGWAQLSEVSRNRAMKVLRGLAAMHPYMTWNMVRTFLHGQDPTINWDVALATVADLGIIVLRNEEVNNRRNGQPFTVRAMAVGDESHDDSEGTTSTVDSVNLERKRGFWDIFRRPS